MFKKFDKKGFSLVELIIVISIMVVLIAVIVPMYLKYVNNTKVSVDVQTGSELATNINTSVADLKTIFTGSLTDPGFICNGSTSGHISFGSDIDVSSVVSKYNSGYSFVIYGSNELGVTEMYLSDDGHSPKWMLYPNPENSGNGASLNVSSGGLKK